MMPAPTTVSVCTPETEEAGKHVFEIIGYSKHKGMGHGNDSFIWSKTFSVGGHRWSIRFYPDGFKARSGEDPYISVYLELMNLISKVRASCDIRLVDRITNLSSSVHKTELQMFDPTNSSMFAPRARVFMKCSELETSGYLRDDRLTIECIVTVTKNPRVSEIKPGPRIEVPPSDIAQHLGKLLEEGERADVTFSVGGHTFGAHRVVLAMRSPVFKAELYGSMREAVTDDTVKVQGIQPAVFKALLHFIYTDSLPAMDGLEGNDRREMIRHLLVAADRYGVDRLKQMCQSILCDDLDAKNVAVTLALADLHHCSMLKDACIEFIFSSSMDDDVLPTKGITAGQEPSYPYLAKMIQFFKKRWMY